MGNRNYKDLAWGFTIPAIVVTACMLIALSKYLANFAALFVFLLIFAWLAPFFALIVLLTLALSICGMVFSIIAARIGYPKNFFLPQLILSTICTALNGIMLFVSVLWI
ncbi:MAG: hypothetical protein HDT24_03855 [Ruminococcus sp.]|nr:hypothetical protein [Ruminococcus sp.]